MWKGVIANCKMVIAKCKFKKLQFSICNFYFVICNLFRPSPSSDRDFRAPVAKPRTFFGEAGIHCQFHGDAPAALFIGLQDPVRNYDDRLVD